MATMNISLPDAMKQWVEKKASGDRYTNSSDYVRDLIRKDQDRFSKIATFQEMVTEGLESGMSERTVGDIWNEVVAKNARQAS